MNVELELLTTANVFLAVLDTEANNRVTDGGIALQHRVVDSHEQTLRIRPELGQHPAFRRYLQRLAITLSKLAEHFGQMESYAYQAFLQASQRYEGQPKE